MIIKMSGDLWIQTSLFMAALLVTLNGEDNFTAIFTTPTSIIRSRDDIPNKTGEVFTKSMEIIAIFVAIGLLSVGFTMTSLYIILKNCQTRQRYSRRLDVNQMGKITGNPEPYYAEIDDIEGKVVNTDVPLNQKISNFRNLSAPIQQPIELRELNDITGGENDNYLTPYHPLDDLRQSDFKYDQFGFY